MIKARTFLYLWLSIWASLLSVSANGEPDKILFHINSPHMLSVLHSYASNLTAETQGNMDIVVVFNGHAVKRLLKNDKEKDKTIKMINSNIKIEACHFALTKNKVDSGLLIEGVKHLDGDGNLAIINYQKKGYIYIKI